MALVVPFIMHEDVRITLQQEELASRSPVHANTCVLIRASFRAAEHVNPEGITGLFTKFGEVLKIVPVSVLGRDMSSVKLVLLVERARDIPNDVWPKHGPWGYRPVQVEVIRVWPLERSFEGGVYQRFFALPPPPPFCSFCRNGGGRLETCDAGTATVAQARVGGGMAGGPRGQMGLHQLALGITASPMGVALFTPPGPPERCAASPPSPLSSVASDCLASEL
jgi:hypothetical protein